MDWFFNRLDRAWQWLAQAFFVRFEFELPIEEIRALSRAGRFTFVLNQGGIIEWLVLSSWCRSQGLGGIVFANRWRILLLSRPQHFFQVVFRRRSFASLYMSSLPGLRLVFLSDRERTRPFTPTGSERFLAEVYSRSADRSNTVFMPVFFLWRRHLRGGGRNLSEYLFGLSSSPNWVGKFFFLWLRPHGSVVRGLELFRLAKPEAEAVAEENEAMIAAKQLRRRLLVALSQETRVMLGPRYRSPSLVKESLIHDAEVQLKIEEIAKGEGVDKKIVLTRAYQNLTEIVANFSFRTIEVMYVLLTWLFSWVFDGLDSDSEEWKVVRETMRHKPVVFVPCHRSHLDYLVIPYVMFSSDMMTPFIAAGINLSFWPLGPWLRAAGAFFIRRSFRGDPLYGLLLRKYIHSLIGNRYNIKFFIEGTRSRSGKMLSPAYGILKMVLGAYENKVCDDIAIVPVSICYDEVPEQGSYSREKRGKEKATENAMELLKSVNVLWRQFGKVYVRLGHTLYAKDLFEEAARLNQDSTLTLQKTAFRISKAINDATPITTKSIVSTVLVCHERRLLSLEDIIRNCRALAQYARIAGAPLSHSSQGEIDRSVEQTIRRHVKNGTLTQTDAVPRQFGCEAKRRTVLSFYKNNAIHCLVTPNIFLLSFLRCLKEGNREGISQQLTVRALGLRDLLKFDFFFNPRHQLQSDLDKCGHFFFGEPAWRSGSLELMWSALLERFETPDDLSVFTRLTGEIMASYAIVGNFLKATPDRTWDKKQFLSRLSKTAETNSPELVGVFPEANSVFNFVNAIQLFEHLNILQSARIRDVPTYSLLQTNAVTPLLTELEAWLGLLSRPFPKTLDG